MQRVHFISLADKFKMGGHKNDLRPSVCLPYFFCKLNSINARRGIGACGHCVGYSGLHFYVQKQDIKGIILFIVKEKGLRR